MLHFPTSSSSLSWLSFFFVSCFLSQFCIASLSMSCPFGVVALDSYNFDRVVDGHRPVFVKIDHILSNRTQPTMHRLSTLVSRSNSSLLLAQLDVSDSPMVGDMYSADVAARYGVHQPQQQPEFLLFPIQTKQKQLVPIVFDLGRSDFEAIQLWLQQQQGVHLGLPGTVKTMHALAIRFVREPANREEILKMAEAALETMNSSDYRRIDNEGGVDEAKYYIVVMKQVISGSSLAFTWKEKQRIERMLKGNLSSQQRKVQQARFNILVDSFLHQNE